MEICATMGLLLGIIVFVMGLYLIMKSKQKPNLNMITRTTSINPSDKQDIQKIGSFDTDKVPTNSTTTDDQKEDIASSDDIHKLWDMPSTTDAADNQDISDEKL